jgi:hypothetical protein
VLLPIDHKSKRAGGLPRALDPKTDLVKFRLTRGERAALDSWAARQGVCLSDALRSLALAAARGRLGELAADIEGEVIS